MWSWLRNRALRLWTADTAALLLYNIPTGLLNLVAEFYVVGSSVHQWLLIHWAIFNPAKYVFAFVEASCKKFLRRKFRATRGTIRRKIIDAVTLACYQIPLYLLASWAGGRTEDQLWKLFGLSLAEHIVFGPCHGWVLDRCEAKFTNGKIREEVLGCEAVRE